MTQLVSIHAIVVSDPNADMVFTGRYTNAGEPILKKSSLRIEPFSFFDIDEEEAERLVSAGAARHPTDNELTLGRVIREQLAPYRENGEARS